MIFLGEDAALKQNKDNQSKWHILKELHPRIHCAYSYRRYSHTAFRKGMDHVDISELNALVQALDEFSDMSIRKYAAAAVMARPHTMEQAKHLVENLDLFDFAPSASTPEEYGKYMIQQSGHFDYDENLDAFYDYEKYGTERMNEEDGMFTDRGYIAYKGYISTEEVMNGGQSSHMEMGGLSR